MRISSFEKPAKANFEQGISSRITPGWHLGETQEFLRDTVCVHKAHLSAKSIFPIW
jgi:hypothetical protein